MKIDFERERRWWDAKAPSEEHDNGDEPVNRALRWREIKRHLDSSVRTILEIGGATGRFSIPLAARGFDVTHVDFSPAVLKIAQEKAAKAKVESIRFLEANATNLAMFADHTFDLVLNMDGAISFCGARAGDAIRESCRVARHKVLMTVSNRAQITASVVRGSLAVSGGFMRAVESFFERGEWHQDEYDDNYLLAEGITQNYFGAFKAFTPQLLRNILENAGMRVLRCGGLGSLSCLCGWENIAAHFENSADLFEEFLDLCERFDAKIMPDGPGTYHRAGVIAVAEW